MKYLLLISLTIVLFSCKNAEKATEEITTTTNKPIVSKPVISEPIKTPEVLKEALFLSMERTPCYGKCPAYKITIFNTGNVIYEGFSNTEYIGKYEKQLSKQQLDDIQKTIDELKILEMKDVYDAEMTDLPSTILFLVSNNTHKKKILDRVDAPSELRQFEKLIDFFVVDEGLKQTSK